MLNDGVQYIVHCTVQYLSLHLGTCSFEYFTCSKFIKSLEDSISCFYLLRYDDAGAEVSFAQAQRLFNYNAISVFIKVNLAMTCSKYKVYLYGSEAITYLNAFLVIRLPPPCTTGSPPPYICTAS